MNSRPFSQSAGQIVSGGQFTSSPKAVAGVQGGSAFPGLGDLVNAEAIALDRLCGLYDRVCDLSSRLKTGEPSPPVARPELALPGSPMGKIDSFQKASAEKILDIAGALDLIDQALFQSRD